MKSCKPWDATVERLGGKEMTRAEVQREHPGYQSRYQPAEQLMTDYIFGLDPSPIVTGAVIVPVNREGGLSGWVPESMAGFQPRSNDKALRGVGGEVIDTEGHENAEDTSGESL